MSIVTVAEVKAYAKISSSSDDELLDTLITAAQSYIEDFTRRKLVPATQTRYYRQTQSRVQGQLLLLDEDLLQLTGLVNGNGTTLQTSDVFLEPLNQGPPYSMLRMKYSTSVWSFNVDGTIAVTGKWGYTDDASFTAVHTHIKQAAIRLATWLYRQKDTSAAEDRPIVSPDGVTVMPSNIPPDVVQLLAPHRRLSR